MVESFARGAREAGHTVDVVPVARMRIGGCLTCESCRADSSRRCVQDDDMQKVYPLLDAADMLVLASPVYYHSFSGQMQCAINRIYALDRPKRLSRAALILSSGSEDVYAGAIYEYRSSFLEYLGLEDMGVFTASEDAGNLEAVLGRLHEFGSGLAETRGGEMPLPEFLSALDSRSPPYLLPSAQLLSGCTQICPVCVWTCPCCIFPVFPCFHGSSPCGAALSGYRLQGTSHRSNGK